uniref:Uncharacterized protein n=1 Tax=Aegilops tauschii subsp. strangulata TaxID=200361 RepID=A0A453KML7_AEGTS
YPVLAVQQRRTSINAGGRRDIRPRRSRHAPFLTPIPPSPCSSPSPAAPLSPSAI